MESTVSLYVRTALEGGTQIPAYTIDLASRQRKFARKKTGDLGLGDVTGSKVIEQNLSDAPRVCRKKWLIQSTTWKGYQRKTRHPNLKSCIIPQFISNGGGRRFPGNQQVQVP